MALLICGFGIQFEVTNLLMATRVFHLSPVGFGLLGTLMAAGGIVGAAIQLFAASAIVYVLKAAPAAQRGHALTAFNAGYMGFVPAGSLVVAGLAAAIGTRWALIGRAP